MIVYSVIRQKENRMVRLIVNAGAADQSTEIGTSRLSASRLRFMVKTVPRLRVRNNKPIEASPAELNNSWRIAAP